MIGIIKITKFEDIKKAEIEVIKSQKQGLNLFPPTAKELAGRSSNYREGFETFPKVLVDEFGVNDTSDLRWFNSIDYYRLGQALITTKNGVFLTTGIILQ